MPEQNAAPGVCAPELEWLDDGVPHAPQFQDTYFSRAGGLAETGHVFHGGNGLPERLAGREVFTIGELGFGTGLNLLATLDLVQSLAHPPHLTFVTLEAYPLSPAQLERAHAAFPDLAASAAMLRSALGAAGIGAGAGAGWHRLELPGLTLWIGLGDANELLPALAASQAPESLCEALPVDAWFLDGFAPARNPELWNAPLLQTVHDLTGVGGTFATYTAAGWVRRALSAAGFTVAKRKGFAGKREMSAGRKEPV